MEVTGFNRVEPIVSQADIDAAVKQVNHVLGTQLGAPHPIAGRPVLSSTDFDDGIELAHPWATLEPSARASEGTGADWPAAVGDHRRQRRRSCRLIAHRDTFNPPPSPARSPISKPSYSNSPNTRPNSNPAEGDDVPDASALVVGRGHVGELLEQQKTVRDTTKPSRS